MWRTLAQAGEAEMTVLNNRFIASGTEVRELAAAEAFLKAVRGRYPDADHHCYAFKLLGPPQIERFSDDGEPSGTAGRPILTVIEHHLANAVIVVTRYFGGTKLGKGGLVKAYTEAAKQLIEQVGTVTREAETTLLLDYPYALAPLLEHWYRRQGFTPVLGYGERVSARLSVAQSRLEALAAELEEWAHQGLRLDARAAGNQPS